MQVPVLILIICFSFFAAATLWALRQTKELKKAQETIEAQKNRIISTVKMASLGEMAGSISHEINTPLAVIQLLSELITAKLEGSGGLDEDVQHSLLKITETVTRISKIIKGLKTFSRASERDPAIPIAPAQIIEDTLNFCREKFKLNSIDLRLKFGALGVIECRPSEISQVVLNLLNNARDAVVKLDVKWVEIETRNEAGNIRITVTDSGSGVAPDLLDKLMQPYFTTKAIGHGTGLGLSISKSLVEKNGGKFYYDKGYTNTRFVMEFPQAKQMKAAS